MPKNKLINYTTEIEASKSVAEIQKILVESGAKAILIDYDNAGEISSLSFKIEVEGRIIGIKLPCDWRPVQQILIDQGLTPKYTTMEQANRVSWRILKDWVRSQMALVAINMVNLEQVFLAYAVMKDGRVLYDHAKEQLLLGDGN